MRSCDVWEFSRRIMHTNQELGSRRLISGSHGTVDVRFALPAELNWDLYCDRLIDSLAEEKINRADEADNQDLEDKLGESHSATYLREEAMIRPARS
jgi:hypothetical protein